MSRARQIGATFSITKCRMSYINTGRYYYFSCVRTLTYLLRFITWGTRELCLFRCARASASVKETFEVGFEPVTWTTSNVKVLPTEL